MIASEVTALRLWTRKVWGMISMTGIINLSECIGCLYLLILLWSLSGINWCSQSELRSRNMAGTITFSLDITRQDLPVHYALYCTFMYEPRSSIHVIETRVYQRRQSPNKAIHFDSSPFSDTDIILWQRIGLSLTSIAIRLHFKDHFHSSRSYRTSTTRRPTSEWQTHLTSIHHSVST